VAMDPLTADDPVEVGGYRLRARLGAGGTGQVYLGFSPGGRPVAAAVAVSITRILLARETDRIERFSECASISSAAAARRGPVDTHGHRR